MAAPKSSLIRFSSFITEGRDAPVYHATEMENALLMLRGDKIIPFTAHPKKLIQGKLGGDFTKTVDGISVTRNLRFARFFQGREGVVFQLDQAKLAQRFKIAPVNHFSITSRSTHREEDEEFIVTNKDIKLSEYLVAIYLMKGSKYTSIDAYQANSSNTYFKELEAVIFSNPKFKGWI